MFKHLFSWIVLAALVLPAVVSASAPPKPVGQTGGWTLVFHDEFGGSALDAKKWTTCYWWASRGGCTIATNHELEWYRPNNVMVGQGLLTLRAKPEKIAVGGKSYPYTSGMITTGPTGERSGPARFVFQYGYVEMRARVPSGKGLWPAFWLLPANRQDRPEIDVMEIMGDQPNTTRMTLHYPTVSGDRESMTQQWTGDDFSADWHTFGADWEPDAVVWYVDGVERWRYTDRTRIPAQPMYLLADLAVGGDWPGAPDISTLFPSDYQINYIRVWSRVNPN
jgi:beta-glucanase (GH16 family)